METVSKAYIPSPNLSMCLSFVSLVRQLAIQASRTLQASSKWRRELILSLGALLGFISVAFGAFAEHGLREGISEEHFRFAMTAVRYNQIHSVVIVALGLAVLSESPFTRIRYFTLSTNLFIIGTCLFSFSIYLGVSLDLPALFNITPLGGISIMAAWLLLALSAALEIRKQTS